MSIFTFVSPLTESIFKAFLGRSLSSSHVMAAFSHLVNRETHTNECTHASMARFCPCIYHGWLMNGESSSPHTRCSISQLVRVALVKNTPVLSIDPSSVTSRRTDGST